MNSCNLPSISTFEASSTRRTCRYSTSFHNIEQLRHGFLSFVKATDSSLGLWRDAHKMETSWGVTATRISATLVVTLAERAWWKANKLR